MKNFKIGKRGDDKVVMFELDGRKIIQEKIITGDFNNVVVQMYKGNDKTIKTLDGKEYKITLERVTSPFGNRYGVTGKKGNYIGTS